MYILFTYTLYIMYNITLHYIASITLFLVQFCIENHKWQDTTVWYTDPNYFCFYNATLPFSYHLARQFIH